MAQGKDGTYFIGGRAGKRKSDGRPYGVVELVIVEGGHGSTQTVFCEPDVAQRALENFDTFAPVTLHMETRMSGRGPRADLVEVSPA